MVSASNPFATRYTKPGALPYRFPGRKCVGAGSDPRGFGHSDADAGELCGGNGFDAAHVDHRLAIKGLLGQLEAGKGNLIVGPHGTGKTTLLHSLMELVGGAFAGCTCIKLDGVQHGWRRWLTVCFGQFRRVFLAVHNLPAGSLLILDGVEQLGLFARQIILLSARLRHVTVLATSHRNLFGMRVVHQTSLDANLIHELVGQLLEGGSVEIQAKVEGWIRDCDLDQVANLREFWFELYDLLQPDLIREAVPSTTRHFENSPAEV